MADISKVSYGGTTYNFKDASAPARPLGDGYSKTGTLPISSTDTISEAIGKLENVTDANQTNILSVEDMITDKEFDSTKSYSIGDVVTYEHKLYKFKSAHSGAWSTSDVDQITVIAYVDDHSGGGGGAVDSVSVGGGTPYTPDANGNIDLPAYPTTLPASDVYLWAKASSKPSYTYSEVGAASSGHSHTLSMASSSRTSSIDLAANTKYQITAGGSTYVFKTPPSDSSSAVTGVKGSNESTYRTGNVSLSYSNVGAASSSHSHSTATTSSSGFMSYSDKEMVNNLGGQSISAANFNNLKTPGCYFIPSSGSSNMPWKNGEKVHLLVYKPDPSSTQNIVQIARAINYPKQMFIRTCYSGTWTNWFKFEGTEVTS